MFFMLYQWIDKQSKHYVPRKQIIKKLFFAIIVIRMGGTLWKWTVHWWRSRTSNPVYRVNSSIGGFDSHALPPTFLIGRFR